MRNRISTLVIVLLCLSSCKAITSILHDDEIVAKVGKKFLYKSELLEIIPSGLSQEDSIILTNQYINSWAAGELVFHLAEEELSENEKKLDKEIEDYKRQLLKYRYEQYYLAKKLDTVVTEKQLEIYYADNKEKFKLEAPIIKARYIKLSSSSPHLEELKLRLKTESLENMMIVDSLAYSSAEEYLDFTDEWKDISSLAAMFGIDSFGILSLIDKNYIEFQDFYGKIHLAQITEFLDEGNIPPLEYYRRNIKDFLISERKHNLSVILERDLINKARDNGEYVIY